MSEPYNGLQILAPMTEAQAGGFDDAAGMNITWFQIPRSFLGGTFGGDMYGTYTPSELITLWFGEDLDSRSDGLNWTQYSADYNSVTGDQQSEFMYWRRNVTIATMVSSVIAWLPTISITDEATGTVGGYLDWQAPWGFVYDVDVLYKSMSGPDLFGRMMAGDALNDTQLDAWTYASLASQDWERAGADGGPTAYSAETGLENSTYPQDAYDELTSTWYYNYSVNWWQNAPTYGLEAVGYDSYDKWSGTDSATGMPDGSLLDANEALHSNEIFRYSPDVLQESEWDNDPVILSAAMTADKQVITWQHHWNVRQIFASGYHAGYQDGSSITHTDSDATWRKTQAQEILDMHDKIDLACDLIAPLLETTDFPKRLINHIQRKKKIPNNMISAFGYVPGEMYTAGTVDSYVLGEDDKISYDPVTGEPMDADASFGSYRTEIDPVTGKPVFIWEGEDRGVEVGWSDDDADGDGISDGGAGEAGTESSDSSRYEGWDD